MDFGELRVGVNVDIQRTDGECRESMQLSVSSDLRRSAGGEKKFMYPSLLMCADQLNALINIMQC